MKRLREEQREGRKTGGGGGVEKAIVEMRQHRCNAIPSDSKTSTLACSHMQIEATTIKCPHQKIKVGTNAPG